jgi:hypothetical protein
MAKQGLFDIGMNDEQSDIIRKLNYNFRLINNALSSTAGSTAISEDISELSAALLEAIENEQTARQNADTSIRNSFAPLNASHIIDPQYLPSYVDDVIEVYPLSGQTELSAGWLSDTAQGSAISPESGKIYILMDDSTTYPTNTQLRWSGSAYVVIYNPSTPAANPTGFLPLSGGTMAGDISFVTSDRRKLLILSDDVVVYTAYIDLHNNTEAYDATGQKIATVSYLLDQQMNGTTYSIYFTQNGVTQCLVKCSTQGMFDLEIGTYTLTYLGDSSGAISGTTQTVEITSVAGGIDPNATSNLTINTTGSIDYKTERSYPTFIKSSWSTSSDPTTLPTTPCFVFSSSDSASYYCTSSSIVRVNSNSTYSAGTNLDLDSSTFNSRYSMVGQSGSTATNPWYKFANIAITNAYADYSITFSVHVPYGSNMDNKFGILTAHIRTDGNIQYNTARLKWEYAANGITPGNFVLAYKNGTNRVDVDLWVKIDSAWTFYSFDVIAESTRADRGKYWTLYKTSSAGSYSAITSGYNQIASTTAMLNNCPFPVNGIYISVSSANPNTIWPGTTWSQIAGGRVIVGQNSSYGAGSTGDPTHTHGMQNHTHSMQSHTHSLQSHTHSLQSHTHVWGLTYYAYWRGLFCTGENAQGDNEVLHLRNQTNTGNALSQWNHDHNNAAQSGSKKLVPAIIEKTAKTDGPSNNTSGGPSNNTSGGPSNNTSGGPSNNTTTASSVMPPWFGAYIWKRTA